MNDDKSKPWPPRSATAPLKVKAPDPALNDLGQEGCCESNIKQNTTDQGQRKDLGD